ncbi:MAG TPA: hypothetical protein VFP19_08250, partial [Candidatus Limnocylindrales bacterium]|nr:hypothetical protein [Candidatus Limnocylindrales bacterium]
MILPGLLVAVIELLSDTALDQALPFPFDTILVTAFVVALAFVFSFVAFRRIDALAASLATRNAELERRNATVRALTQVGLAISAITGLDRVLQAVVDQARELLRADGAVLLVDAGSGGRVTRATSGSDVSATDPAPGASRLEVPLQRGEG